MPENRLKKALLQFVGTVEATGGVSRRTRAPVGDPDWLDLGDAYLNACRTLGRRPKYARTM